MITMTKVIGCLCAAFFVRHFIHCADESDTGVRLTSIIPRTKGVLYGRSCGRYCSTKNDWNGMKKPPENDK
jgi:hypothetical protein